MTFFFKKKGLTKKLTFLFLFIFFIAFLFFREGDVYAWVCHDPGRSACQEPPDPTNPACPSGWEMVPGCNSEGCTLSNMSHDLFKYWCNNSGQGGAQPGTVPVVPQSSNNQQQQLPETPVVVPTQEVPIPGLTFTNKIEFCSSNPDLTDMSQCPSGDRVFVIPWLGQYIIAIYKWALRAIVILAIFMIMLGGVQWIISHGSPAGITSAKSKIGASIIAVVIILSVNLILSLINPELTILKPITIGRIATISLEAQGFINDTQLSPNSIECAKEQDLASIDDSPYIVFTSKNSTPKLRKETAEKLKLAAQRLYELDKEKPIKLQVNNASRTLKQQIFLCNDGRQKDNSTCPAKSSGRSCESVLCNDCPHTLGYGVDVACEGKSTKENGSCGLTKIMRDIGFCQLASEAWHFEYPKMSSTCY